MAIGGRGERRGRGKKPRKRRKRLSPGRREGRKRGSFQICGAPAIRGGVSPTSYVLVACMYAWTTAVGRHFIRDFIHSEFLAKVKDNRHRPVSLLRHPALKRA